MTLKKRPTNDPPQHTNTHTHTHTHTFLRGVGELVHKKPVYRRDCP